MASVPPSFGSVELAPHQRELAQIVATRDVGTVQVLAPPGRGRTFATAVGLARRIESQPAHQLVLVAVGNRVLSEQWEHVLRSHGVDAAVVGHSSFRKIQLRTPTGLNPFDQLGANVVVVTLDFAKSPLVLEQLLSIPWDVIVIDEYQDSRSETQQGHATSELMALARSALVVCIPSLGRRSAPIDGAVVVELRPTLASRSVVPLVPETDAVDTVVLRNVYEFARTVEAPLGPLLARRAASSLYAAQQTLRRLIAVSSSDKVLPEDYPQGEEPANRDLVWSGELDVGLIEQLLEEIDGVDVDAKWSRANDLIKQHVGDGSGHVALFTEFADTADYLAFRADRSGHAVEEATGRLTFENEEAARRAFRDNGGVLIQTAATGSLSFADHAIHYDIPFRLDALEARFRQLESLNPSGSATHYVFADRFLASINEDYRRALDAALEGGARASFSPGSSENR